MVVDPGVHAADRRLRELISASASELVEEREVARAAVRTLRLTLLDRTSVEQGDVFVGVYWQGYGWTSADSAVSGPREGVLGERRYDGRRMSPRDALARAHRCSQLETTSTRCVRLAGTSRQAVVEEPRGDGAAGQEACMHGRMAIYTISGDARELARRAEEGMLPIFQAQTGFKSYSLVASGDELLSFSAWESEEDAEAANEAAASWIAENMADKIELKETKTGEILLGTAIGVSTKAGISV